MTAGRKPLPNQLKVLKGTDQPCRMRDDVSVEKVSKMPPPPKWLGDTARKLYKTKSQFLIGAGIISVGDIEMFVTFCHEFGRYIETAEKLSEVNHSAVLSEKQEQLYWRLTKINRDSFDRARSLAGEFGFTPISRLKFAAPVEDNDPLAQIMKAFK